ncbi:MAG TPA: protein kinase [Anaerolineae bacterium]
MTDPVQLIGQKVEHYVITKHIARGGMADVYLAQDENLKRQVALKIMLPALAADQQFVERFRREAQTVARLDHPNIIQVYSIGVTATNRPYIAMQYIKGGALRDTLEQVVRQGNLVDVKQALGIIAKMAEALSVAHEAGIVHRDIKPSNILIRPDGTPVLVDLGIAAVEGGPKLTQTGTLMGTPHYMSPEQASGKPVDARSDIYSLGVILYELLTGRPPFEAEDALAVLHMHVYEDPTPVDVLRPGLSPEAKHVVEMCLQKNPDYRFQKATALQNAVHQAMRAEGGTGIITDSGVWLPEPTEEYRLSPSKIIRSLTPTGRIAGTGQRRWLYVLIPVVLALSLFAVYRFVPSFSLSANTARLTPVAVVTDEATATSAPPTAGGAGPSTAVPTSTFAPLPTFTPQPTPTPTATLTATATLLPTATADLGPETTVVGQSVRGVPIEAVRFGAGPNEIVFIGGLHAGFAPATVVLAQRAVNHFTDNRQEIPPTVTLYIIPNANPDSPPDPGRLSGRLNANNVDLNRNWDCRWTPDATFGGNVVPGSGGPAPFSEPETKALADFLVQLDPVAVVFWEARASLGLSSPGGCGDESLVSVPLSQVYGLAAGYQIVSFEELTDQLLNGDGTNWLDQQSIPSVAILLPDYDDLDWDNNLAGMRAVLDRYGR